MSKRVPDQRGIAPDRCRTALLLIDVINDFDFPDAPRLLRYAGPAAHRIAKLKGRLERKQVPVIYVNDNFGRWRSDFAAQVEHCLEQNVAGRAITELLRPGPEDYFVLKPKHSGFFSTTLDVLLEYLGADTLVLCGFAGNLCVLYTANDAYMRDFNIIVPSDCIASESERANNDALDHMKRFLRAKIAASARIRVPGVRRRGAR